MKKTVCSNKRAFFDYQILDRWEAGLVLTGTEVKAFRESQVSLQGAWIRLNSEVDLIDCHVAAKVPAWQQYNPVRVKKLLLKKSEIKKIRSLLIKGLTLIPLEIYFNERGLAKISIALAKGKKLYDKRKKLDAEITKKELK